MFQNLIKFSHLKSAGSAVNCSETQVHDYSWRDPNFWQIIEEKIYFSFSLHCFWLKVCFYINLFNIYSFCFKTIKHVK